MVFVVLSNVNFFQTSFFHVEHHGCFGAKDHLLSHKSYCFQYHFSFGNTYSLHWRISCAIVCNITVRTLNMEQMKTTDTHELLTPPLTLQHAPPTLRHPVAIVISRLTSLEASSRTLLNITHTCRCGLYCIYRNTALLLCL